MVDAMIDKERGWTEDALIVSWFVLYIPAGWFRLQVASCLQHHMEVKQ